MPSSTDPTETADIGDLEQRHAAQANHLDRLARMAAPLGYTIADNVALEHLRAEADNARTMRRAIHQVAAELHDHNYESVSPNELYAMATWLREAAGVTTSQPDPPAAA